MQRRFVVKFIDTQNKQSVQHKTMTIIFQIKLFYENRKTSLKELNFVHKKGKLYIVHNYD